MKLKIKKYLLIFTYFQISISFLLMFITLSIMMWNSHTWVENLGNTAVINFLFGFLGSAALLLIE